MKNVHTFGRYLREKFGTKVYKTPISLPGFTCPNIDGSVAIGGCTFCENESFSPNFNSAVVPKRSTINSFSAHNPFLEVQLMALEAQYKRTKNRLAKKFKAKKFLVYFQSFSNTYAPLDTLKELYEKALSLDDVLGLSIGTRSDCVSEGLLDYLSELSKKHEIWIEFGIQSIYDETLHAINRGHDFSSVQKSIKACKERGLKVCGHFIFGLPNETKEMMLSGVQKAIELGVDSFKFHPLYVVKNTAMANDIKNGKLETMSEDEFLEVLCEAILILPQNVSVQRISAGIGDDSLVAPIWCKIKHDQMQHARKKLLEKVLVY